MSNYDAVACAATDRSVHDCAAADGHAFVFNIRQTYYASNSGIAAYYSVHHGAVVHSTAISVADYAATVRLITYQKSV